MIVGQAAMPTAPAPGLPPGPAGQPAVVAIEDWDDLFLAVRTRLELTVGTLAATLPEGEGAVWIRTGVLECVEALGQLHDMLRHERERGHGLEREVFDLRTVLTMTLTEVVEMQRPAPVAGSPTGVTHGV